MIVHKISVALLLLAMPALRPVLAQKPTYAIEVQEHVNRKTFTSTFTQRVYERKTGKTIWLRHFPGYGNITWSKDRQSVVFETGPTSAEATHHRHAITLVMWIAGQKPKRFSPTPPITDDYTEDFYWSPDKKHLLLRTGGSGASTVDIGKLWCLNLKTHKAISLDNSVRKTQWAGTEDVKYWVVRYAHGSYGTSQPYMFSKPRRWHLPSGF